MTQILTLANNDSAIVSDAKMNIASHTTQLMPGGKPDFSALSQRPSLKEIANVSGMAETLTVLGMLIGNFCHSMNVVRNMNEDQVAECAMYLLDECKDFRIEDYVMMFAMAKRGKLGTIMDRVDIEVISDIHHEYLNQRQRAFKAIQEQERDAKHKQHLQDVQNQTPEQKGRIDAIMQEAKAIAESFTTPNEDLYKKRDENIKRHQEQLMKQLDLVEKSKNKES